MTGSENRAQREAMRSVAAPQSGPQAERSETLLRRYLAAGLYATLRRGERERAQATERDRTHE